LLAHGWWFSTGTSAFPTTKTGRHDIAEILLKVALHTKIKNQSQCILYNRIGGVMVCMLASSAVDRGFAPRSGQIKDYEIGICCYAAKHSALRLCNVSNIQYKIK
jgi:hypothetical protein